MQEMYCYVLQGILTFFSQNKGSNVSESCKSCVFVILHVQN